MQNLNVIKKNEQFWTLSLQTALQKKLDYVEDMKNCAKYEKLTLFNNAGSILFYRKVCL